MSKLSDGLKEIATSITRRKGNFVLARSPKGESKPYSLAVGSSRAVQVNGGLMIMIGLSRDQVEKLRAMCDEALAEGSSN